MGILKRVGNKLIQTDKNWEGVGKGLKNIKDSAEAKQNIYKTAGNIANLAQRKVYDKLSQGEQPDLESSVKAMARDKAIVVKDPVHGPKKVVENWKKYGYRNISTKKRD